MVHRHELAAVRERALDLHFDDHLGHLVHDVCAAEQLTAEIHQLRDRAAVANEFHDLRADQRDRFRIVEAQPAREALLCEIAGLMQRELVELVRCQMHDVHHFLLQRSSPTSGDRNERSLRSVCATCSTLVPAMRSRAPPSRSVAAERTRSAPRAIGAAARRLTRSVACFGDERPADDRGQQHVEAAHACGDGVDARFEHDSVEEHPLRAAPDVESALVTRKRPALSGCMAARRHPIHHHEARIGVQVVSLRL